MNRIDATARDYVIDCAERQRARELETAWCVLVEAGIKFGGDADDDEMLAWYRTWLRARANGPAAQPVPGDDNDVGRTQLDGAPLKPRRTVLSVAD